MASQARTASLSSPLVAILPRRLIAALDQVRARSSISFCSGVLLGRPAGLPDWPGFQLVRFRLPVFRLLAGEFTACVLRNLLPACTGLSRRVQARRARAPKRKPPASLACPFR